MKTVRNIAKVTKTPKFPYLVRNKEENFILMVLSKKAKTTDAVGVVVEDPRNHWGVGNFDDIWSVFSDPKDWEVLPVGSSVTLTQE